MRHFGQLLDQLKSENNMIILELFYKIMYKATTNWLPLHTARLVNKYISYFFLFKAKVSLEDKEMQYFCIHRGLDFFYEQELMDLVASWYTEHNGRIVIDEVELTFTIPTMIHYLLIKKVFRSATLTHEQKNQINDVVFQGFLTDSSLRVRQECSLSVPHPEVKAYMWENLTKPEKAMAISLYDYSMMARSFFQPFIPYHFEMVEHYCDEFFLVVPDLMLRLDRARAEAFLKSVSPCIRCEPEDEAKLRSLLDEATQPDSPLNQLSFYVSYLQDQLHYIETLETVSNANFR